MSLFNTIMPGSNQFSLIFDEIELKRNITKYINRVKKSAWYYNCNHIFISPGNSFNVKYFIKFLSMNLVKRNQVSKKSLSSIDSENLNQLISLEHSSTANETDVIKHNTLVKDKEEVVIDDILDGLTGEEFFRLLNIEPEKRLEILMYHYDVFNKILDDVPFEKLDKLNNTDIKTEVPYKIYIESSEYVPLNYKNEINDVNTVKSNDLMGLLKTCGVILIDISRDFTALSRGKEIFSSFKREIVTMKDEDRVLAMKNKRLIVVLSTVMTWAGSNKKRTVSEDYVDNRIPNPEFTEHYEFELEVLAVNKTERLNTILRTIVIWTGLTYGFEQDLLRFAFDSACKSSDLFLIPSNLNFVPVIHVENLARLLHKIITESHTLNDCGIFATEHPTNSLKQIITALGNACNVGTSNYVSLNSFINKHKLEGLHKQLIAVDIKVNSSISRLWPKFEWYNGKWSMVNKMKYLVDTYKIEHNIKSTKLLILGPPGSGKTKLAHQLAKHYNLIYLEPRKITKNHIDEVIAKLMELRQINQNLLDNFDDDQTKVNEKDPVTTKKNVELDQYLEKLYLSIDSNNGVLEDNYLIPLLNEKISNSVSSICGYVLDGYPMTIDRFKQLFGDISPLQQINVNKLPDLTIYLKQETQSNLPLVYSGDINTIPETFETKSVKRHIVFAEVNAISSSDPALMVTSKSSIIAAKTILKKSTKNNLRGNPKNLIWNEQNHNDLLKIISCYYVPIKIIDSPHSSFYLNGSKSELVETNLTFLNIVIKEIEMNLGLLKNMNKTNSISDEINDELKKNKALQLMEKMTLVEDFEKVTDFEHIENLSTEEYLMKYAIPLLTKLIVQLAKVRPKNPVHFLAHMALKENPEGFPELPGYSKEGLKVKNILEHMFHITNDFKNNDMNLNILLEMLTIHPSEDKDDTNREK